MESVQKAQNQKKKFNTYDLVFVGVMAAVVFASNFLRIHFGEIASLHFGNVACVLSGLLFGALRGGLCAGIGSAFYDLCDPVFVAEAPITFLTKFALGFVTGWISHHGGKEGKHYPTNIVASVSGSLTYIVLYLAKGFIQQYFLYKNPMDTVLTIMAAKAVTSLINGAVAVIAAVVIIPILQRILDRAGIWKKLAVR